MCAVKYISAKDNLFKTQVSSFAKHLETTETKVGLEILVCNFSKVFSFFPHAFINKMKVEDFESSFEPSKITLIFSVLELLISN